MKKIKRLSVVLIAALICAMILAPVTVFAATTSDSIAGSTITFCKYLIVPAGVKVPNATFAYTVKAGTGKAESSTTMEVFPGVDVDKVTVNDTVFGPADTLSGTATATQIDVVRTDRANVKLETASGEQFAVQTATVSFAAVHFTEPGIYRYVITETASEEDAAKGILHDDDTDRFLDVYVIDSNGSLVVSSYVLHTKDENVTLGGTPDDKTDGFTNEFKPSNLSFIKQVSGNQASHDKVFEFTLKLANLTPADQLVVSITDDNDANTVDGNADATSVGNDATIAANTGKVNVTELTVDKDGKVEQKFYLQHDQSIAVRGLALNATYEVTENAENYNSAAAAVAGYTDATSGTMRVDVKTSYLNTRNGVVPTGIMLTVVPGVAIVVIALIGLAIIKRKKNEA